MIFHFKRLIYKDTFFVNRCPQVSIKCKLKRQGTTVLKCKWFFWVTDKLRGTAVSRNHPLQRAAVFLGVRARRWNQLDSHSWQWSMGSVWWEPFRTYKFMTCSCRFDSGRLLFSSSLSLFLLLLPSLLPIVTIDKRGTSKVFWCIPRISFKFGSECIPPYQTKAP